MSDLPGTSSAPIMRNAAVLRETLHRIRATGIRILDVEVARLLPATVVADYRPFVEVAAELGARHILTTGNDPHEGRLIDNLHDLAVLAGEFGLNVTLEFVPWMSISRLQDALKVVRSANRPNAGVLIDTLHFDRSGGRLEDLLELPDQAVFYMQLCDAASGRSLDQESMLHTATHDRLPPGDGAIDLVGILRNVPAVPLALEIPMTELAKTMPAPERARMLAEATRSFIATRVPAGNL